MPHLAVLSTASAKADQVHLPGCIVLPQTDGFNEAACSIILLAFNILQLFNFDPSLNSKLKVLIPAREVSRLTTSSNPGTLDVDGC